MGFERQSTSVKMPLCASASRNALARAGLFVVVLMKRNEALAGKSLDEIGLRGPSSELDRPSIIKHEKRIGKLSISTYSVPPFIHHVSTLSVSASVIHDDVSLHSSCAETVSVRRRDNMMLP